MISPAGWWARLLGVALGVALIASIASTRPFAHRLRLAANDAVFWREGGPRLGARPARADVVVVELEQADAVALGRVPTVEDDLRVYANLLAGGAKAVGDVRLLAGDGPESRAFLDLLREVQPPPKVYRDVWLTHAGDAARFVAHDPLSIASEWTASAQTRWYPILVYDGGETRETLAAVLARVTLGLPSAGDRGADAAAAGVDAVRKAALDLGPLPRVKPLPFGERAIVWEPYPVPVAAIAPAAIRIDYGVSPRDVRRISYGEAWNAPPSGIAGAVAIVGMDSDLERGYHVPPSPNRAENAAMITALAWQTLVDGRTLRALSPLRRMFAIFALALAGATAAGTLARRWAALAIFFVLLLWIWASVISFRGGSSADLVLAPFALLASAGAVATLRWRVEESARKRATDLFSRYVPRDVVAQVLASGDLSLGGAKREITVMFADIRGYTSYSQALPPEKVVTELNALLALMVECVFRHGGTVDKYMGDAIMVLFNAPLDQPDHAQRAIRAAADMQRALAGHPSGLAFGIGIHTGEAVVGNVGTIERMEYTAIGSTVNLASRLCGTAMRGEIVVSAETRAKAGDELAFDARDPIRVKGIDHDLVTFVVAA